MVRPAQSASVQGSHPAYDVVAVATSAGGLHALSAVLSALPEQFPIAIVVVQHLEANRKSFLTDILDKRTGLHVKQAAEGDHLQPHTVYIAPPGHHLLVDGHGTLHLSDTERINFVKPAADRLFESVATSFKARAIAVILTGMGSDGAKGMQSVKHMGGITIAQDKATSEHFGMPGAAILTQAIDYILPLEAIAPKLIELSNPTSVTHPTRPHKA
jgi:two-component system chemotaxis response regulator CheB